MKNNYAVAEATDPASLDKVIGLRYRVLRQPWGQSLESARDALESSSVNACIENEHGEVIACGRLQENEGLVGQIRYMAVDPHYQGKGLGRLVLVYLEKKAVLLGMKKIQLHARVNAVSFYLGNGYVLVEKSHNLWGQIQHYLMEKPLSPREANL